VKFADRHIQVFETNGHPGIDSHQTKCREVLHWGVNHHNNTRLYHTTYHVISKCFTISVKLTHHKITSMLFKSQSIGYQRSGDAQVVVPTNSGQGRLRYQSSEDWFSIWLETCTEMKHLTPCCDNGKTPERACHYTTGGPSPLANVLCSVHEHMLASTCCKSSSSDTFSRQSATM